ncbi:MAG: tetratricopeptide repeat protein [Burkholderiales bacterium]|nr:tetratricopeptide repeat protein [Burkholderiales bacterium]
MLNASNRLTALSRAARLLCVAAAMAWTATALADDYTDVNALLRSGKLSEALNKADQYLAAKPRDAQMRFLKGVIQTESGKPADAITTFNKLTEDYPELPEPYNNLAVLYAGQSQFDKARAALEMAIRTNPSYATAHENLGDVYAKLASQAYSKALQLDSNNTGVQPKLALIRDLFSPAGRAQKSGASAAAAPPSAPVATASKAPSPATAPSPAPVQVAKAPVAAPVAKAPVAPPVTAAASAPTAAAPSGTEKDVETAVRAWAAAWAAKDMTAYLAAYDKEFDPPGSQSRKAWEDERRARIVGKARISVGIDNLSVQVRGDKATARFRQSYVADALKVSSRKTLELVKTGDHWAIVKESTGG